MKKAQNPEGDESWMYDWFAGRNLNEQIEYDVQEKAGKERVYDMRERGKHIVEDS